MDRFFAVNLLNVFVLNSSFFNRVVTRSKPLRSPLNLRKFLVVSNKRLTSIECSRVYVNIIELRGN